MIHAEVISPIHFFAQTYGCDSYGESAYNTCATTTSPSNGGNSSSLADTGLTIGIFVIVAVVVMVLALAVRFWRRKKTAPKTPQNSATKSRTD